MGNRITQPLLVGMENGTDTLEVSLAVSYKIKHTVAIEHKNYTPGRLFIPENWKLFTQKPVNTCS